MPHTPENLGLNQPPEAQGQGELAKAREAEARRQLIEEQRAKGLRFLERKKARDDVRRFIADPEAVKREEKQKERKKLGLD